MLMLTAFLQLQGRCGRISVKRETSIINKRTILTMWKVQNQCQNNRRKRALCTMRTKMSKRSEINADLCRLQKVFYSALA